MCDARMKVDGLGGNLLISGTSTPVTILDVSSHGLSFISPTAFEIGKQLDCEVMISAGIVDVSAEVRSCRRYEEDQALFRTGIYVTNMNRVSKARWSEFQKSFE